jgi:hypothetical protein
MTGPQPDYRLAESTLREILAEAELRIDELEGCTTPPRAS